MTTAPTQIETAPARPGNRHCATPFDFEYRPSRKPHLSTPLKLCAPSNGRFLLKAGAMSSFAQTLRMPALKNILFATDFSPCSQAALPLLCAIAERYGSTLHVLHVLAPEPTMIGIPLDNFPELDADRNVAESAMNALLAGRPFLI